MTFFERFNNQYTKLLDAWTCDKHPKCKGYKRAKTYRKMFEYLVSLNKPTYNILETGCARHLDNWAGDGNSTRLFSEFVAEYGGDVYSIDIDPTAVDIIRRAYPQVHAFNFDSVFFLKKGRRLLPRKIDLLYLDSFDLNEGYEVQSAQHHLNELLAIKDLLSTETLVVVDDHHTDKFSKAMEVQKFFEARGNKPYFKEYQIGWIWGNNKE